MVRLGGSDFSGKAAVDRQVMGLTSLETIRQRMRQFADHEAVGVSPLYEHLARNVAEDDDVAGLLGAVDEAFARPTLLLAAAHRLVLAEPVSDLACYYPSVGGDFGVDSGTWPAFRSFVLDRAERMRVLVSSHTTQTNEVRRAALLYPAAALVAEQAGGPLGLLEVGCSAGLLLGLDLYGYRYTLPGGEQVTAGPRKAPLVLECALTLAGAAKKPPLPSRLAVAAKVGLDRKPIDAGDEEQLAWLEACIWADQPERLRRLGLAVAVQRQRRPEMVAGDAVEDLAAAASRVPAELPLMVFHSHTLPYLDAERRADFVAALGELSRRRSLWWVSEEAYQAALRLVLPDRGDLRFSGPNPFGVLALARWEDGKPVARALARTGFHGQTMEWLNLD